MTSCKPMFTLMTLKEKLHLSDNEEKIEAIIYTNLIGSFIYLTIAKPNIVQVVGVSYLKIYM